MRHTVGQALGASLAEKLAASAVGLKAHEHLGVVGHDLGHEGEIDVALRVFAQAMAVPIVHGLWRRELHQIFLVLVLPRSAATHDPIAPMAVAPAAAAAMEDER